MESYFTKKEYYIEKWEQNKNSAFLNVKSQNLLHIEHLKRRLI
jgi:hypothetical protein